MRAIVIGAGEVGFDVARILATEQHDVTVVDIDGKALENIRDKLDVLTIQGGGTSAEVLLECGIRKADMLIAVTTIDEVNIIACMMADRLGVETTVARVRSDELTRSHSVLKATDFGIDLLIHPEESAANEVVRLIRRASATDVLTFADGRINLVGMRIDVDSPAIGKTLHQLVLELPSIPFRIMGIGRGIRTVLPRGQERLHKNDQVFVLARPKHIPHIARILGKSESRIDSVMILGGTKVGARVASQLGGVRHMSLKLVEPNRAVATQLAETLEGVLVIHGDVTDLDLLVAEGLAEMDAFVAVTNDEESNLVSCLMAKHLGVKKTVALLSKGGYVPISQAIGLDAAVSTKLAVSREVLRFLRGKHVMSVATIYGLDLEVLEMVAEIRSPITRKPLKELALPSGILIGAVMHGRDLEVAMGETEIEAGDRVITFVLPSRIGELEGLFSK